MFKEGATQSLPRQAHFLVPAHSAGVGEGGEGEDGSQHLSFAVTHLAAALGLNRGRGRGGGRAVVSYLCWAESGRQ